VLLFGLRKVGLLCFVGLLFIALSVSHMCWAQAPESFSLISIGEDGSLNCSNLPDLSVIPIKREGEVYTLMGNIKSYGPGIEIWRSGITLDGAGFALQGMTGGQGIHLAPNVGGVTVKNLKITNFDTGVLVNANSGNVFVGNDVSGNLYDGYSLSSVSCNNTISGCKVSDNPRRGISIVGRDQSLSTGNLIFGNTIENNGWERWTIPSYGMDDYGAGVWLWGAANNTFYGNKFVNNAQQVYLFDHGENVWSLNLPKGGNFWSDFTGVDVNGDGIGDTQYIIDEGNVDLYPLVASSPQPSSPSHTQVTEIQPQSHFPLEYIIALVAVVVVVVVVIAVIYKKRKHPHQV